MRCQEWREVIQFPQWSLNLPLNIQGYQCISLRFHELLTLWLMWLPSCHQAPPHALCRDDGVKEPCLSCPPLACCWQCRDGNRPAVIYSFSWLLWASFTLQVWHWGCYRRNWVTNFWWALSFLFKMLSPVSVSCPSLTHNLSHCCLGLEQVPCSLMVYQFRYQLLQNLGAPVKAPLHFETSTMA